MESSHFVGNFNSLEFLRVVLRGSELVAGVQHSLVLIEVLLGFLILMLEAMCRSVRDWNMNM